MNQTRNCIAEEEAAEMSPAEAVERLRAAARKYAEKAPPGCLPGTEHTFFNALASAAFDYAQVRCRVATEAVFLRGRRGVKANLETA